MRRYSATEAIGPAWEHTKALLWRDRNRGRLLKLSLVAFGAELGNSFNFHFQNGSGAGMDRISLTLVASFFAFFALFSLAIYVLCLYLGSRLQLAQFDILVLRDPRVAPAWERHGHHTWRWAGLRFVLTLGVLLVLSPLLIPAIPIFAALFRELQTTASLPGQTPHWNIHWPAVVALIGEIFALVLAAVLLIRFVTNLVLPGLAMEDLRFGAALRRGWDLFRTDVGGMLLFAVVQPLFLFVLGMLMAVAGVFALMLLALPFGLVGGLLWLLLHKAGMVAWFVLGTFGVIAGLVILVAWALVYVAMAGTLLTFARTWSLYFLGGRYPLLGHYLEPEVAVPVWTPPPSLPRDDPGHGPDLPVNPALA